MTYEEFKKDMSDEVTLSGALAITIPDAEYDRIIKRELNTLYEIDPDATTESYCVIPMLTFYDKQFRINRTIQFPDCVMGIGKFVEMRHRGTPISSFDRDFSMTRMFQNDVWFGSMSGLDNIAFRTIQWSVWDLLRSFTLVDINHTFNRASHTLLVMGHDPTANVFCQLYTKTDPQYLYDNVWVRKWISAHCKLQANKIMTLYQTNLVGGVTINMQSYTDEASKDIEDCKAKFIELAKVPTMYTMP